MVCLLADEETMGDIMDIFYYKLNRECKPFIDDDYPDNFGWTAVAFHPIKKEIGDKYFGQLRLA